VYAAGKSLLRKNVIEIEDELAKVKEKGPLAAERWFATESDETRQD